MDLKAEEMNMTRPSALKVTIGNSCQENCFVKFKQSTKRLMNCFCEKDEHLKIKIQRKV